ncbi:HAD-IIIA family hydrolase [Cupriavidus respiraculi]|uniref:D,D-heptose 1,7-bisphosphate phosphatase n=1 Tax=Cupriavidus respiraculi TaxID=195930 RepID=A0ABN7Z209_9BURK|nr:HAD family hydrolase [Cupriavidus respiraculi]CAG9179183.1 Histidine biosynthesis bifunctional protein HisB [Cupriavidus respiraculi]
MAVIARTAPAAADAGRRPGVLLDKDGTLLVNVPYNVDPAHMRLAPQAAEALRRLGELGLPLIVVSNQPGIALGRFAPQALEAVRQRLAELFEANGAVLADFLYCPHHPEGQVLAYAGRCRCRKPGTAMLEEAAVRHGLDLRRSWMVGDILDDVEAGRAAGCRAILVDCGNETEWVRSPLRTPDYVVADLDAAARIVAADAVMGAARTALSEAVAS